MNERKWTPGPWVAEATRDLMIWVALGYADGEIIAQLDSVNPYDAHLIAAAPELYDACEAVFDAADMTVKEQYAALKLVVAAMAKARGEA